MFSWLSTILGALFSTLHFWWLPHQCIFCLPVLRRQNNFFMSFHHNTLQQLSWLKWLGWPFSWLRMPTWRIGWFAYHPYRRYCLFIHPKLLLHFPLGKKNTPNSSQHEISPFQPLLQKTRKSFLWFLLKGQDPRSSIIAFHSLSPRFPTDTAAIHPFKKNSGRELPRDLLRNIHNAKFIGLGPRKLNI